MDTGKTTHADRRKDFTNNKQPEELSLIFTKMSKASVRKTLSKVTGITIMKVSLEKERGKKYS